jgi:hypothetical protein
VRRRVRDLRVRLAKRSAARRRSLGIEIIIPYRVSRSL